MREPKNIKTSAAVFQAGQAIEQLTKEYNIVIDEHSVFRQRDPNIDYGMAVDGLIMRSASNQFKLTVAQLE